MNHKLFTPFVLVALGVMFLAHNLGYWPSLGQLWATWWPLVLIVVGINIYLRPRSCRTREKSHE